MYNVPGQLYSLLAQHKDLIYSGAGSVLCSLSNGVSAQGEGALFSPDHADYDAADELRGLPSFTGVSYDPDTGLVVSADQAELALDQEKVTIGRPEKGWTGKMRNFDSTDLNFRVTDVMQDRTIGGYRIVLEILKASGAGRRIRRTGEGGV